MRLPEEFESKLWHDIQTIKGERNVRYVTGVERLAIERGIQQGMETGLAEGRAEGSSALLVRLLNRRIGPLPTTIIERLAQATPDQLEIWADRVLDADNLDDVFREN